jgi:menaquinone-dependent protoporphyrinogen oxidase
VAVASKHHGTEEIAERIATTLRQQGVSAALTTLEPGAPIEAADAFVVGSAVYAGRWMAEAREFIRTHSAELSAAPVWLFSSGPVGEPPVEADDPHDLPEMTELTKASQNRMFAGRLDHTKLGVFERAIVGALRAPEGDFRPWPDIEAWATEIAHAVQGANAPS